MALAFVDAAADAPLLSAWQSAVQREAGVEVVGHVEAIFDAIVRAVIH